jgi:hypothetical protein
MTTPRLRIRRGYLLLAALFCTHFLLIAQHEVSKTFSLACMERAEIEFTTDTLGLIKSEATWSPTATAALILYGPGKMNHFARTDGQGLTTLVFSVSDNILSKGKSWRVALVNQTDTVITGILKVSFPEKLKGM